MFSTDSKNVDLFPVALSSEGKTLAIGAPRASTEWSGHVVVYGWANEDSNWVQLYEEITGETSEDSSGHSLALSSNGKILAVGEPQENDSDGNVPGQVRVFSLVRLTSTICCSLLFCYFSYKLLFVGSS